MAEYNWSDLICPQCTDEALHQRSIPGAVRWGGNLESIRCGACRRRVDQAAREHPERISVVACDGTDRLGSAVHEAGHAVIGHDLGARIEWMTLDHAPKDVAHARTHLGNSEMQLVDYATMLCAGIEAHLHWLGPEASRRDRLDAVLGGQGDQDAVEAAVRTVGADLAATWTHARTRAQAMVSHHRTTIEALAAELDRTGHLTEADIQHITRIAGHRPGTATVSASTSMRMPRQEGARSRPSRVSSR